MCYQETFIRTKNIKLLLNFMKKHNIKQEMRNNDFAEIICISECKNQIKKDSFCINTGDILIVVAGEKSPQSTKNNMFYTEDLLSKDEISIINECQLIPVDLCVSQKKYSTFFKDLEYIDI